MKINWLLLAIIGTHLPACTPTVKLETPAEGITINMNVMVDHKIEVSMDEKSHSVIKTVDQAEPQ